MGSTEVSVKDLQLASLPRYSDEWLHDRPAVIRRLHAAGELARADGHVEILSYEGARQLLSDPRVREGTSAFLGEATGTLGAFVNDGLLSAMDGERHDRIRRALTRAFTKKRVDQEREVIRSVANGLVDSFIQDGACDLVAQFTHPYPVHVVARVLGVPAADIPRFEHWTVQLAHMVDLPVGSGWELASEAAGELARYLEELVETRRTAPADDFISALIEVQHLGGTLNDSELKQNLVNLLLAGHDTTRYQLATAVMLLLQDREQWERLVAEPALSAAAVREAMRLHPAVRVINRIPRADWSWGGVVFPAGMVVRANIEAANRDPNVFADPDRFDIDRPNASDHIGFGLGSHYCIGAALSTAEMTEALTIFATRLVDLELDGAPSLSMNPGVLGGPESLPIRFRAGAPAAG